MNSPDLSQPDSRQSAIFYDRIAENYDENVTRQSTDTLARTAFQALVRHYVPTGSTVLDFGCGTGLDALEYARTGYRVIAYDTSEGMLSRLELRCREEIASGQIRVCGGDLLAGQLTQLASPHAITANFAVLNLISHPSTLLAALARNMAAPGWLIISALNPLHWSILSSRILVSRRSERADPNGTSLPQPCPTYRHSISDLSAAARDFHLVGLAHAGTFVRYDESFRGNAGRRLWWGDADSPAKLCKRALWRTGACKFLGSFMFLVFRRNQ